MKCYITHTTENYEQVTINLARSISKYSKYPLVVYTVDYDAGEELKQLAFCRRINLDIPPPGINDMSSKDGIFYVNRASYRTYLALSSKIDCILQAIKDGVTEWAYLDGDCVANINVDSIFDYSENVKDYPLAPLSPYEYLVLNKGGVWRGSPFNDNDGTTDFKRTLEWPLMEFFRMDPSQREGNKYKTTNILLGNIKCLEFLKIWKETKDLLPKITDSNWYAPFHEETIYNVLTWKYPYHLCMPMIYINITGAESVMHYLNHNFDKKYTAGIDIDPQTGEKMKDYLSYPSEKDLIKVFHGEKRKNEVDKIFVILDNLVK
jgi:hypothetical protein